MTQQEIDDVIMVGKYMGIENLFPYEDKDGVLAVYIAEDDEGSLNYKYGIDWYFPYGNWDTLMPVCKKIIESYFDKREDIFEGLQTCDIKKTYTACVEFIKFWNDESQEKMTWTNSTK